MLGRMIPHVSGPSDRILDGRPRRNRTTRSAGHGCFTVAIRAVFLFENAFAARHITRRSEVERRIHVGKQIRRFSGCQFGLLLPHDLGAWFHIALASNPGATGVWRSPGEVRRAIPPASIQAMATGASFIDEKLLATCRASGQNL